MATEILIANPIRGGARRARKSKRKSTRRKNPVARRKLSAKQIAAGFGGKRAKSASRSHRKNPRRGRSHHRRSSSRSHRRRNPTSAPASHGHRRRRVRQVLGGIVTRDLVPAAVGATGALALDMLWPHLDFIPSQFQTGPLAPFVRIGAALLVGMAGGMIVNKRFGTMMTVGAVIPTLVDIGKGYIAAAAPLPPASAGAG